MFVINYKVGGLGWQVMHGPYKFEENDRAISLLALCITLHLCMFNNFKSILFNSIDGYYLTGLHQNLNITVKAGSIN